MSEGDRLVRVGLVILAPSLLLFLWWVLLLRPQHEAQREMFDTFRSYTLELQTPTHSPAS